MSKIPQEAIEAAEKTLSHEAVWIGRETLIRALEAADAAIAKGAEAHPDDLAVDRFAAAMKAKLAQKRDEGRGGWDNPDECTVEFLSDLLRGHVFKGDPVDVGNFAMMIHQRKGRISLAYGGGHVPSSGSSRQKRIPMIKSKLSASQQKARDALAAKAPSQTDRAEGGV